ncbi:MAG: diguanylate cyclase, partial [Acholeplasma sp.]|nr:diguanylate cyclase [Acholeplasma sp.]
SKWEYNVLYYRLGGDEFFVYCYDHDRHQVESRAQQLISEIEQLNDISKAVNVSVSVGIVEITHENKGYHNLLNLGDQTMYISKSRGPGNYTFYQK